MSRWREFARRYFQGRTILFGTGLLAIFVFVSLLSSYLVKYPYYQIATAKPFTPPNYQHLFGTDNIGRDVYSGVVHGIGISLFVGIVAGLISTAIGVPLGIVAAYYGGWIDALSSDVVQFFLIIPPFFIAIIVAAFFGTTYWLVAIIIGALIWPPMAAAVRAQVSSLRHVEFVEAAKAVGVGNASIIFKEILPNVTSIIVVNAVLLMSRAVLLESSLSFLGLGDQNAMSLGTILNNAQTFVLLSWWLPVFPGIALLLMVLSFNLVGDGLSRSLSPHLFRE